MVTFINKYFMDEFARKVGVTRRQIERYRAAGWLKPAGCKPGGRNMYFTDVEVELCRERGLRRRGLKHAVESITRHGTTPLSVSEKDSRFVQELLTKRHLGSQHFSFKDLTSTSGKPDFMD